MLLFRLFRRTCPSLVAVVVVVAATVVVAVVVVVVALTVALASFFLRRNLTKTWPPTALKRTSTSSGSTSKIPSRK